MFLQISTLISRCLVYTSVRRALRLDGALSSRHLPLIPHLLLCSSKVSMALTIMFFSVRYDGFYLPVFSSLSFGTTPTRRRECWYHPASQTSAFRDIWCAISIPICVITPSTSPTLKPLLDAIWRIKISQIPDLSLKPRIVPVRPFHEYWHFFHYVLHCHNTKVYLKYGLLMKTYLAIGRKLVSPPTGKLFFLWDKLKPPSSGFITRKLLIT